MADELSDKFKDLNDLEFEIVFIDSIAKKLKSTDKADVRSETLLLIYYGIVESLKKFKQMAIESNRTIPHEDAVDLIISKCDSFLISVANNEGKALYVQQSLKDTNEIVKSLLFNLKKDLVETPEYNHLKVQ